MPVSIFRITPDGELDSFSGDITNPTGVAFNRAGNLFVTSRLTGIVYRIDDFKEATPFADDLGVATGIAFNRAGDLFVGNRSGVIYRITPAGEVSSWATHEPSVSAYHLAFGPDGMLYVTGPTVSSYDVIVRFDQWGKSSVFFRGLGRPQGLAFDVDGNLYVAASYRGRRGIIRITPDGKQAELAVSGMNIVGLCFSAEGDIVVATTNAVYSVPVGIKGLLLA
jgi:sugar lactone lactonase YvrE